MDRSLCALVLLVLLSACGSQSNQASPATNPANPPSIKAITTMSILADVIQQVGGSRVQVDNIIPRGAGPEDYQATPGDSQKIAAADVVFFNGHALEEWLEPLFENAAATQTRIELSAGMTALEDGQAAEGTNQEGNPHFWLDPTAVMTYTSRIRDTLIQLDPVGEAEYSANAASYIKQLEQLDADLQAQAKSIPAERRKLVTNHDAFPYFAKRYGFEIIGVLLENPEAELAAGELSQLVEAVKLHGVPTIFAESQFNQRTAQVLADEAGVQQIAVLYTDTLGDGEASSYIEMMRYNMQTIVSALQ